jgi:anti-sigma factor RsiW
VSDIVDDTTHPDDLLSALADGELDDAEAETVEAHVAACSECATELADITRVRAIVRDAPVVDAPDGLVDSLIKRRRRATRHGAILGAAAAIVAVATSVAMADPADHASPKASKTPVLDTLAEERIARFGFEGSTSQRDESDDDASLTDRAEEAARDLLGFLTGE